MIKMGWLKTKLRNWALKGEVKSKPLDEISIFANEYLKRSLKQNADALKLAEKLNKARVLELHTKQIKEKLNEFIDDNEDDEDDEDEYEQPDESDFFMDKVAKTIIDKLGAQPSTANSPPLNAPQIQTPIRQKASKALREMSDEQLKILDKKGFL